MVKVKLLADCFGPTVIGKKGDVVEINARHIAGLGGLVRAAIRKSAKKRRSKAK